jgi:energy-coupling factor transporter ATP-binding protein EcfA2
MIELDEVARQIAARPAPAGTRVVAIDGPSGSGKSTLAARLKERMPGSTVIAIDDFGSWGDPTGQTWWDRFEQQLLVPAFAGQSLRYQVRDWANDEFGSALAGWRSAPASRVVIIEGVGSARACVRSRGAFTIWIDAPEERRLERGLQRDGDSHRDLWLAWMKVERDFFSRDQTRANANLRINGDPAAPYDPATQLITS